LWDDPKKAEPILREKSQLSAKITRFENLNNGLQDNIDLIELAESENDTTSLKEAEDALEEIWRDTQLFEIEALFSGEADGNNCFLEINSGAGGTESQDWAEMLLRMYLRWAEKHQFKTEILAQQEGEEAGVKSVTLKINGVNAYGWLKVESGVHRLVRISPFNSGGKRMTSFASVWTYPEVDDNINITIDDKDLRVDTYRASGAGGQHVNKTDSAIRLTHLPTNVVVQCQNSRSQHRNRDEAMKMLKSRLYELELRKKTEKLAETNASKTEIGWGHQIRSYVLQPYQMVKDLRTEFETSNINAVLDGDLDGFLSAALSQKIM
jgi:peptide chain release factor 2